MQNISPRIPRRETTTKITMPRQSITSRLCPTWRRRAYRQARRTPTTATFLLETKPETFPIASSTAPLASTTNYRTMLVSSTSSALPRRPCFSRTIMRPLASRQQSVSIQWSKSTSPCEPPQMHIINFSTVESQRAQRHVTLFHRDS